MWNYEGLSSPKREQEPDDTVLPVPHIARLHYDPYRDPRLSHQETQLLALKKDTKTLKEVVREHKKALRKKNKNIKI